MKFNYINKTSVLTLFFLAFQAQVLIAEKTISSTFGRSSSKTMIPATDQFDGNRVRNDMENNGMIVSHRITGHSGMEWPKENNTYSVFASGIWYAGKVGDDLRCATAEYGPEMVSGQYGENSSNAGYKIWKVNKSDLADPLASYDFQNWPALQGAPWVDNDGDGVYSPMPAGSDHPEFLGDQVIWFVRNDGDAVAHTIFQTLPLGIEVQTTVFGFDRPDAFGDMMFVKELIINKGGNSIDDMYIGLWSDPDLGDAGDDFVGCDTTLGLGFCWNDGVDADYSSYSGGTPAVGYDFFQGPVVAGAVTDTAFAFGKRIPGKKNLGMSSFVKYINGDPVYTDPNDVQEVYYYMQGKMRDGSDFPLSATGGSNYVHPGNPSDDTGSSDDVLVDPDLNSSGDRRFLMNTGPFQMAPLDSQEVVFAIMHAAAGEAKASVDYLKQVDLLAQLAYDIEFALPASPPTPEVEATTLKDEILLSWDNLAESYNQIDVIDKLPIPVSFDTTFSTMINDIITTTIDTTIDGSDTTITTTIDTTFEYIQVVESIDTTFQGEDTYFTFEGYNVYQHETESGSGVTKRIATYDLNNGLTEIYDDVFSPDLGQSINRVVQHGSDSGIKRTLFIDKDQLNGGSPLKTNRNYYFSVTSYGYNPYGIPKTLESASKIMLIKPQVPNNWAADAETAEIGALISSSHVGGSDGTIMVKVVDPTKLTGDTYEVSINMGYFYRDLNGVWQTAATDSTIGAAKTIDCSGSTLTASAIASAAVGTVDLTFTFDMVCGSNWVDGIQLDLPDDLTVNSWDAIGECDYGAGSGQNCVNMDGTLDATTNTITWGDSARSGFGAIQGGQVWIVNVSPPASYPISVEYDVWDDGYDATIVDASGSASVSELGYDFKTFQHWNVENTTTGAMVVEDQTMVSGISYENVVNGALVPGTTGLGETANPVFDGIQVMVNGPTNGIHGVWQTANANGPIAGVDSDVNENVMWINFLTAPDYPTEQAQGGWFFAVHGGGTPNDMESFYARVFRGSNFSRAIPNDFEMRFTTDALTSGMGYRRFEDGLIMGGVPFELWNIRSTPDDASDDYRMLPAILNYGGDNADAYDFGGEDAHSSADNDPSSDWVYWGNPDDMSPGAAGYDAFHAPGIGSEPTGGWTEVIARTRLMNWNGYVSTQDSVLLSEMSSTDTLAWTAADTATLLERGWFLSGVNSMGHWSVEADANGVDHVWGIILNDPEVGTVYRMITNKPNTTEDTFAFTTDGITGNGSIVYEPGNINVWPNPYFGYNPEERNPLDQRVQFTHLPDDGSSSKIRIFDLAGQPIRTISHDGSSQSVDWDLTNNYNVPVSSGMYLAYVETSEGSKILKVGIVQPEQRIDVY
jgi:hypothetical protein